MKNAASLQRRDLSVRTILILVLVLGFAAARAQMSTPAAPEPIPAKAAGWPPPVEDNPVFAHVLFDQLEGRTSSSGTQLRWDAEGWVGTDTDRLWVKSEGFANGDTVSDGDHEALYDRPIPHLRYFDAQAGVRVDGDSDPTRVWAALGVEGLAPYSFEIAPTLYISDRGRVAGRVNGSWDLYLTQRWAVQPEAELNFYSQDDPARKIGSGFSDIDTGVRLRYEVTRKFAPYIGWAYNGQFGGSARYTHLAGEPTGNSSFVFGLRVWH